MATQNESDKLKIPKGQIDYKTFTATMRAFNNKYYQQGLRLKGVIVFKPVNGMEPYDLQGRSYGVSNDNKAWIAGMGGYSIFGGSLDGEDVCTRLDYHMAEEHGGPKGWIVDYCYFDN